MPPTIVSLTESAVSDLEMIRAWYTEQGVPDVGERPVAEIFERVASLTEHPDIGRVVPEFDQPFIPELIHPPFRIVYRRDQRNVRVIRIWRSERLLRLPE